MRPVHRLLDRALVQLRLAQGRAEGRRGDEDDLGRGRVLSRLRIPNGLDERREGRSEGRKGDVLGSYRQTCVVGAEPYN
jgi:hypothetical protein